MKTLSIIVLALAALLTPTLDSCWKALADQMTAIQALEDAGTITAKEATRQRRLAHKAYLKCLDSIPPGTPNQ
jgi:Tfp pilus assembly protein PilV